MRFAFALAHTIIILSAPNLGALFIVIVNVFAGPAQTAAPFIKVGVTVMVLVMGALLVFRAVNAGIFPMPETGRPIEGLEFTQVKAVPGTVPVNATVEMFAPLHTSMLEVGFTEGDGLMIKVNCLAAPGQLASVGVTVMLAVIGAAELLTAEKDGMFPVPEALRPIEVLLFAQV